MSVRPIVRLGHPALRTAAQPVPPAELGAEVWQRLIDDLVATMRAAEGVGLAAPQLAVGSQVVVYEAEESEKEAGIPLRVVVNPMVEPEPGELVYDWEGCLSIPDLRGLVPRHPAVRVRGLDRDGKALAFRAAGFEARIVQHEFDHLNGIVFLDRMRDLHSLAYYDEWEQYLVATADRAHGARPE